MIHFYAYLSRMKHIKRWGLMRNTEQENIKEHSLDVAVLAHGLALIGNTYFNKNHDAEHIMALAVFHEAGEVITGDLATPIKYFNPEIKKTFGKVEKLALKKILSMLPKELAPAYEKLLFAKEEEAYQIVKAADKLSAYIKCVEEIKTGNQEFSKAKNKIAADIAAIELAEVEFFMQNCMKSYALTLDELN
jgi:5'-deoxynucleotidase